MAATYPLRRVARVLWMGCHFGIAELECGHLSDCVSKGAKRARCWQCAFHHPALPEPLRSQRELRSLRHLKP